MNLQTKTDSCRVFDLTALPCVHTLAAAHNRRIDPYTFCSKLEQLVYQTFVLVNKYIIILFHTNVLFYLFIYLFLRFILSMHG